MELLAVLLLLEVILSVAQTEEASPSAVLALSQSQSRGMNLLRLGNL